MQFRPSPPCLASQGLVSRRWSTPGASGQFSADTDGLHLNTFVQGHRNELPHCLYRLFSSAHRPDHICATLATRPLQRPRRTDMVQLCPCRQYGSWWCTARLVTSAGTDRDAVLQEMRGPETAQSTPLQILQALRESLTFTGKLTRS